MDTKCDIDVHGMDVYGSTDSILYTKLVKIRFVFNLSIKMFNDLALAISHDNEFQYREQLCSRKNKTTSLFKEVLSCLKL